MLTRKHNQIKDIQDGFTISSQCFQFDPILESITKFLNFKECGCVSIMNRCYHSKTWKYFLLSSKVAKNEIKINQTSIPWIVKYNKFLIHQNLKINSFQDIDLSIIPKLHSLYISNCFQNRLPHEVKFLSFCCVKGSILDMYNNENVKLYASTLTASSTMVKTLIIVEEDANCAVLPNFPNLKELRIHCNFLLYPLLLLDKYPNLKILHLDCNNVNFIHSLSSYKHTLVILSENLIDISSFSILQCSKLDLSNCPNIQDFSAVAHLPIVLKKMQK